MFTQLQKQFIFKQLRIGKHGRSFILYKFRTMYLGAEHDQYKFKHLNQGTPPAFKILNDPRFTRIGKFLSNSGIDEIPQLINILKGEMTIIGPRPLPVSEFKKLPLKWQKARNSVKPGVISSWVVEGGHSLSPQKWHQYDLTDIENSQNLIYKLKLFFKFLIFFLKKI